MVNAFETPPDREEDDMSLQDFIGDVEVLGLTEAELLI